MIKAYILKYKILCLVSVALFASSCMHTNKSVMEDNTTGKRKVASESPLVNKAWDFILQLPMGAFFITDVSFGLDITTQQAKYAIEMLRLQDHVILLRPETRDSHGNLVAPSVWMAAKACLRLNNIY